MKIELSPESAPASIAGGGSVLGKQEFLRLLTTQLRYQDPLNPLEDKEFIAQLAQFSSLEQMFNLNDSFQNNLLLSQSVNNTLAASLIGREAKVQSDSGHLEEGGLLKFEYELGDSANVRIEILNGEGETVFDTAKGIETKGEHTFTWDGKLSDGSDAPEGDYTLKVTALDADGNTVDTNLYLIALVEGVSFAGGSAYLIVSGSEMPLASVASVMAQ